MATTANPASSPRTDTDIGRRVLSTLAVGRLVNRWPGLLPPQPALGRVDRVGPRRATSGFRHLGSPAKRSRGPPHAVPLRHLPGAVLTHAARRGTTRCPVTRCRPSCQQWEPWQKSRCDRRRRGGAALELSSRYGTKKPVTSKMAWAVGPGAGATKVTERVPPVPTVTAFARSSPTGKLRVELVGSFIGAGPRYR